MIKDFHLAIFRELLKDANIWSITPLKDAEKCGIFYDEIHNHYVVTGLNIEYNNSLLHKYVKHPTSLEN